MKTIKVFLASSEELEMERLQFDSLFNHLNRIFRPRGLYLELSKWEYLDSSMGPKHKQEEYNEELKTCEMCMVMYWTKFGEYTGEELMTAYGELKEGRNPRKLYVFFKEPGDVTPELKSFKESFATEYGHFYCKFENVDSMRLHFLLQLEAYQNNEMKDLVKVEDSKVKVDGKAMVDLDNIPFAAKNRRYRELKNEIEKIESEIRTFEGVLAAGPNEAISDLLGKKRSERYYKKEELSEHENFLFDTAVRIAQQQGDRISGRMARAIQAFEDGRAGDANAILEEALHDAKELRKDIARTKELLKQQQESAAVSISELLLKASVTLADDSKPVNDRIEETHEIYREAYALANESAYDQEKYMELLEKYGDFLSAYAKYDKAELIGTELLKVRLSVYGNLNQYVATSYNYLGVIYNRLCNIGKALEYHNKALNIRLSIFGNYHKDVATSYYNLSQTYIQIDDYSKALEYGKNALTIDMSVLGENHYNVVQDYFNMATIYGVRGCDNKAEEYSEKGFSLALSILGTEDLSLSTCYYERGTYYGTQGNFVRALDCYEKSLNIELNILGEYHPNVAETYLKIGDCYLSLKDYVKSMEYYEKSLKISFDERHLFLARVYSSMGSVYECQNDYEKALESFKKALTIRIDLWGENHSDVAFCYSCIGSVYDNMGNYVKSLEYYGKSLQINKEVFGENTPQCYDDYVIIGSLYDNLGQYDKALDNCNKALDIYLFDSMGDSGFSKTEKYSSHFLDLVEYVETLKKKIEESSGSSSGGSFLSRLFKKKK